MESTIQVPPDMKSAKTEEKRKLYEKEQKAKLFDEKKKQNYFYALRKRVSENDAMVVRIHKEGSIYLQ